MNWLGLASGYLYGYKNWTWILIFILIIVFFYRRTPYNGYGYRAPAFYGGIRGISPYYFYNFARSNVFFTVLLIVLILVVGRWCC